MNWESGEARKKYLLGELSEAQQQEFERALLAAPEQAEALELAEQELLDAYLHDELTASERRRFDEYFLASPARKRQLLTAQALVQYANEQAARTIVQPRAGGNWLDNLRGWLFGEWKLALACTLLAVLSGVLAWWFFGKAAAPVAELARQATPTPTLTPTAAPTATAAVSPSPAAALPGDELPGDELIVRDIRASRRSDPAESLIREKRNEAVGLLESKLVWLESSGAARQISSEVQKRLQAGGQFRFTTNRDEAEIALKLTVATLPGDRLRLTARIIDANGKVIWPLTPQSSRRSYEGLTGKVLERLRTDLLGDVRRLKQKTQ